MEVHAKVGVRQIYFVKRLTAFYYLQQRGYVIARFCPSVCLFINRITYNFFKRFSCNLLGLWTAVMGRFIKFWD